MIELRDVDDRDHDATDVLPNPGQVAISVAKGFLLLLVALLAVGLTITYLDPLRPIREWDLSVNERLSTDRSDAAVSAARTATLVCWLGLAVALKWLGARWAAGILWVFGLVAVASMAWARVYVGMHHPTDVTAGVLLGVASVAIARRSLDAADPVPSPVDHPDPREVE